MWFVFLQGHFQRRSVDYSPKQQVRYACMLSIFVIAISPSHHMCLAVLWKLNAARQIAPLYALQHFQWISRTIAAKLKLFLFCPTKQKYGYSIDVAIWIFIRKLTKNVRCRFLFFNGSFDMPCFFSFLIPVKITNE